MELSVVVPTLNGREELAGSLDALAEEVPDAETIVVNGPSADGTTGMVRDRDDVDVLVEVADRSVNVARNAGLDRATGDAVAIVSQGLSVESGWAEAVRSGVDSSVAVTGPTHEQLVAGMTTESKETRTIAGRDVTYFNPGNVAFRRTAIDALDGFDEYLQIGGSRDVAHRLAARGYTVGWDAEMCVSREFEADGGIRETDWNWKYRSLAYRLLKNYGVRPTVARRMLSHAGIDAAEALKDVARGETPPSKWLGTGRDVLRGLGLGSKDGLVARYRDRSDARNPNGRSIRADRAVTVYDRR
ncbi:MULTISPECIES: glycosyltransferase family 2 protein [Haloarcula]|uniref:Glycosyl transferase family 2 n=1 Tax=Haloarcula pellucida TaxID=1427151 RepID=A0A830GHS7_9EURY|nr:MULTISPECIES: glycosyltransferase family A protein [Halomicroarcula]MBX0346695.1 glycosyltransferase family 2 protein [Halomicroarcula pellucida]MDS0277448.1 glycosyltransferase family 2 protein [Halomicroarcula sp. S1AR25-4]GGN85079.1 glycosyl transferase family 2 [Halomicroarcula pellucida]